PVIENLLEKVAAAPVVTESETVIELPPPDDEAPAADEVEAGPVEAIGEAPAAIDEVVVPPPAEPVAEAPAETEVEPDAAPDIEPEPEPVAEPEPQPESPAEPEPQTAAAIDAETEREADDETNE